MLPPLLPRAGPRTLAQMFVCGSCGRYEDRRSRTKYNYQSRLSASLLYPRPAQSSAVDLPQIRPVNLAVKLTFVGDPGPSWNSELTRPGMLDCEVDRDRPPSERPISAARSTPRVSSSAPRSSCAFKRCRRATRPTVASQVIPDHTVALPKSRHLLIPKLEVHVCAVEEHDRRAAALSFVIEAPHRPHEIGAVAFLQENPALGCEGSRSANLFITLPGAQQILDSGRASARGGRGRPA